MHADAGASGGAYGVHGWDEVGVRQVGGIIGCVGRMGSPISPQLT